MFAVFFETMAIVLEEEACMRKIHKKLMVSFFLAIFFVGAPARAENITNLNFGCAPWDGRTLEISIGAPDMLIRITVWSQGFEALRKGERTVIINNKMDSPDIRDATGKASITGTGVPDAAPVEKNMSIHFDDLELKEGGKASGYVQEPGGIQIPFQGSILAGELCG
jgi:hypothetical protein